MMTQYVLIDRNGIIKELLGNSLYDLLNSIQYELTHTDGVPEHDKTWLEWSNKVDESGDQIRLIKINDKENKDLIGKKIHHKQLATLL